MASSKFTKFRKLNINLIVFSPAGVRTNFGEALGLNSDNFAKLVEEHGKHYPVGRGGEPSDICSSIMFLSSDEASWITGVNLVVDGGALHSPGVNAVQLNVKLD